MNRSLRLSLNKFGTVPNSLRSNPAINEAAQEINIDLASLYHHYYLDSYGRTPPDPNPANFEYLQFLAPGPDFRLSGDGIGISAAKRRHSSNELGQAFCRKFLHDHLNITYFAHLEKVIGRLLHPAFPGLQILREKEGDTPDYFCAENVDKIFVAEAKGRYSSVSFKNAEFAAWRNQFGRISIRNSKNVSLSAKGFIVATRLACQQKPAVNSGLFAEDPEIQGDVPLAEFSRQLGPIIIAIHYSDIALKIGQPILSSALLNGFSIPDEIGIPAILWELTIGPQKGKRFVGGFYGTAEGLDPVFRGDDKKFAWSSANPFRLDFSTAPFVGLDAGVFRSLVFAARSNDPELAGRVEIAPEFAFVFSGLSILKDGSAIGPLDFFRPVAQEIF